MDAMMPLFSRYALTRDEAERLLGRPLTGDPSRGERAAVHALANLDLARVQVLLDDEHIGEDFRSLVEERTAAATKRGAKQFIVEISISGNAYDHYRRLARELGLPMAAVVAAAVERDFAAARGANRLHSEPILLQLTEYIQELIGLLKADQGDSEFAAGVVSLNDLGQRLRAQVESERERR
jgi:hypothetical protein